MNRRDALTEVFLNSLPITADSYPNLIHAVQDIVRDVITVEKNNELYAAANVLRRLIEPDRILSFRVTWEDDAQQVHVNKGWRVQGSQAIGPYKGGLRFHPSVDEDTLRFLAFEQCFKNALTGLPLGGAKGGSDFDPKGRSDAEIMRFCQAFMRQLAPSIGPDTDVPAGDINVGPREIGYLFGAWREQSGKYGGALTGKGLPYGGSHMRVEATGYGLVYFTQCALAARNKMIDGKRVAVSGKGNVATLLGSDDTPLRPCMLWKDTRSHAQAAAMDAQPAFREITGNIVFPGFTAPKVDWVRLHEPDTFEKTAKILLPKDYLRLFLTGEHVSEMSDAAGTSWLDTGARDWSDDLLARCHLSRGHMPRLVEGSAVSGRLRKSLADEFGLPDCVVAGGADHFAMV